MATPSGPVVFISHSRVREGKLEELRRFLRTGAPLLEAGKPRTQAFLAYLDVDAETLSIVHVFPDADAMATHIEGAAERTEASSEFIETGTIDVYGAPSDDVLAVLRGNPAISLNLRPTYVAGLLRAAADGGPGVR